MIAYRRAFNYGTTPAPPGAVVNRNFHFQFVAFMSALAQYFRDLMIGEVIRGRPRSTERPFGSQATIQRARHRPALRARPRELRQHPRADAGDRRSTCSRSRAARHARHQEVVRRQHQVGRHRGRVEPPSRRRGRAVAARQDGRGRPPRAAIHRRQRLQARPRSRHLPGRRRSRSARRPKPGSPPIA